MKKYRINEIFYSIQGEGLYTGTPAVFVRFSGCNLACPFCDTQFREYEELTADEVVERMEKENIGNCQLCVVTGGEPTLQWDIDLFNAIHDAGYKINMESNGTLPLPAPVDYLTVSPKLQWTKLSLDELTYQACDELKVVMDMDTKINDLLSLAEKFNPDANLYIQPCDTGYIKTNKEIIERCIDFIKRHPEWSLSLQQQKIINVR